MIYSVINRHLVALFAWRARARTYTTTPHCSLHTIAPSRSIHTTDEFDPRNEDVIAVPNAMRYYESLSSTSFEEHRLAALAAHSATSSNGRADDVRSRPELV